MGVARRRQGGRAGHARRSLPAILAWPAFSSFLSDAVVSFVGARLAGPAGTDRFGDAAASPGDVFRRPQGRSAAAQAACASGHYVVPSRALGRRGGSRRSPPLANHAAPLVEH